jgi:hypothetical protein
MGTLYRRGQTCWALIDALLALGGALAAFWTFVL